ncbi:4-hydroxy-3-methylbut-2-enyl diphosphate reductase [Pseudomonas antarctica]|uniref:4-hydroxy-3-methylbut-2-enyl diphosphate reductase n=1 Tax=Pseudomonas antarctica TaxID=219572 RepID=A0A1H0B5G5_9PSED|nr:4-hydroxy-3-methylbut-2-enyl diphosphate reductase [Pseudomonas antarctica]KAF2405809.1 4-hydroxy-3-methylbut-2-enyl diphosphate reductase [Pseudomonas antarctica]SDN40822.1 4-hydroxy-3-methylbut-2-enyl diphosphate reductase [Pseudomonas antarctica]
MNIILAQPRGFCAGVVRAIDTVEQALGQFGAPVYVRHEIVHNRHVVEALRDQGAVFVEELEHVPLGAVTIFSAHGVARDVEHQASRRQLEVIDATCPLVTKVHNHARQYAAKGYQLILIGEPGHPEVIGILGQVDAPITLIQTLEQVRALTFPATTSLAYLTQTTLSVDDTRTVVEALTRRYPSIVGPAARDICYAVQNRQQAVRELCTQVDVLLVVGSANSANATTLCTLANASGTPSYLVADGSEVDTRWFTPQMNVGISAGASTPETSVQDVIAALERTGPVHIQTLEGRAERVQFRPPTGLIARQ